MEQVHEQISGVKYKKLNTVNEKDNRTTIKAMDMDNSLGKAKNMREIDRGGKQRRKTNGWSFGEWNVRGLNGKEEELWQEFEDLKLSVLAITETKEKVKK